MWLLLKVLSGTIFLSWGGKSLNECVVGHLDADQGLVQATQSEEGKLLLTDHLKDQFC